MEQALAEDKEKSDGPTRICRTGAGEGNFGLLKFFCSIKKLLESAPQGRRRLQSSFPKIALGESLNWLVRI